ncbi:nuclease/helicase [Bryobacterales bacterium F-183]|nr:nuclease/helicase [Bryobacterales bacterium F-183]
MTTGATPTAANSSLFPFTVPQDAAQRKRALDPETSFLVQAPAGSGKTELLIQRYLTLLARVDEPEEILAITFTKKAAAEMRDRVAAALERPNSDAAHAALAQDEHRHWRLAQNPGRMRIDTIDAFAHSIVRAMPWLSRFGSMPEPVEDATALYRQAASRTLRLLGGGNATDAAAIRTLLRHLDVNASLCERMIAQMLARREQWLPVIAGEDPNALRPTLEANIAHLVRLELRAIHDHAPDFALGLLPEPEPRALAQWKDVIERFLTQSGDWRKRVTGLVQAETRILDQLRAPEYDALRDLLHAARHLPPPYYQARQWPVLEALFHTLKLAAANLRVVFQSRGQVDFSEIAAAALEALGPIEAPTDLGLTLGHRIRHLLVDEFQDTSQSQRDLLLKLTAGWDEGDGRTVFLVGDPMQSIYRFREAEVGVFLETRTSGLGPVLPEPLAIQVNFRSSPELVSWANQCFTQAFPQTEDPAMGAAVFADSVPFRWEPGLVRVHPAFDRNDEAEAQLVATLVEEARRDSPGKSVAVLVRARAHLTEIVREFRRRGWRYRAVKVDTLAESPVVRDLLALTRALVHLADRPAWLAVLRAPWCGLTLQDLEAIAGNDRISSIWTLLRSSGLRLSPDGEARVRALCAALDPVMVQRRRVPLRQWVEAAWLRLGGPEACCGQSAMAQEDAAAYLDLLDEFDDGGDLPEFDRIEARLRDIFTKPDPSADDTLQVMTIHQAKGLEFDTVILPGLGKLGRQDDRRLLHWLRQGDRLVLAPVPASEQESDPVYKYLETIEQRKDANELVRLLYVAVTRARRTLHLIGHTNVKKTGEMGRPSRGSLLHRMWPMVEEQFSEAFASQASGKNRVPISHDPRATPVPSPNLTRIATGWRPQSVRMEPDSSRIEATDDNTIETLFTWTGNTLRHIGVMTHAMLHRAISDPSAWTADPEAWVRAHRPRLRRMLESLGVPAGECADAAAKVETAVLRTMQDDRGAWTLAPQDTSRAGAGSELAVTGVDAQGRVVRGVVDRTFLDNDGVRWIIDYKTSTHEGGELEWFLDGEQLRYRPQLERYGRLFRLAEPERPIRLGLYFPLLGAWREWELQ